jgi:transposase
MKALLEICCGLDIHKDLIEACIVKGKPEEEPILIRASFSTMRGDLFKLRGWLLENNCYNVAMESTGVYWKALFDILEENEEMVLCVVNARHMRNLPGRKTDVKDAQWIAELFRHGLLNESFIPEKQIRILRDYTRFYRKYKQDRSNHVVRIEKFLQTHGFKLSSVISDIVGLTGRRILDWLSQNGSIGTTIVSSLIDKRVRKSADEIAYAINGKLEPSLRVLLKRMLIILDEFDLQLHELESETQALMSSITESMALVDSIPGIDKTAATYILCEIGQDMNPFPDAAHLCSWAGLSPGCNESAGKQKSTRINQGNPYIKTILCQCAWAVVKTRNTRIAKWFWSRQGRIGQKKCIIAVARKLLVYIYNILKTRMPYDCNRDILAMEGLQVK